MSELVTGEAVAVDLPYARLASRAVAFGLDLLVQAAAFGILAAIIIEGAEVDGALRVALLLTAFILVVVGYPVTFETLTRGRSLGKMALGLRVVRDDGGAIRFRHALVRALAGAFTDFYGFGLFGFSAVVVSLSSARGKRLGDYLAGTVVIRVRAAKAADIWPEPMPPQLQDWASTIDLSRLPDQLALAVRQYLGRWNQLDSHVRHDLGQRLVKQVSEYVEPPPPYTPNFDYLAAVLAERRRRDGPQAAAVEPAPPPEVPPPTTPARTQIDNAANPFRPPE